MSGPFPPPPPSAPANAATNPFPKLDVPFVNQSGLISPLWARLLQLVWTKAGGAGSGAPVSITVGTSPYTYTAGSAGTVVISGGTVSALSLTRAGTTVALGVIAGPIPVRSNDEVNVTYSSVPTMEFLPL